MVCLKLFLSNLSMWSVRINGSHVPEASLIAWQPPAPHLQRLDQDLRDLIITHTDSASYDQILDLLEQKTQQSSSRKPINRRWLQHYIYGLKARRAKGDQKSDCDSQNNGGGVEEDEPKKQSLEDDRTELELHGPVEHQDESIVTVLHLPVEEGQQLSGTQSFVQSDATVLTLESHDLSEAVSMATGDTGPMPASIVNSSGNIVLMDNLLISPHNKTPHTVETYRTQAVTSMPAATVHSTIHPHTRSASSAKGNSRTRRKCTFPAMASSHPVTRSQTQSSASVQVLGDTESGLIVLHQDPNSEGEDFSQMMLQVMETVEKFDKNKRMT